MAVSVVAFNTARILNPDIFSIFLFFFAPVIAVALTGHNLYLFTKNRIKKVNLVWLTVAHSAFLVFYVFVFFPASMSI